MAKRKELEKTIGRWYAHTPDLSHDARRWLTGNIWWLALIGAVASACGFLVVIPALLTTFSVYHAGAVVVHGAYHMVVSGTSWLSLVLMLAGYLATTFLLGLSVPPLKAKRKAGWELLFWSVLASAILNIMSGLLVYSILNVVDAVVTALIAGYLLFEIRSGFTARDKHTAIKSRARE